ncbi:MAG: hypothetical protein ACRYE8_04765 [Janthinobacterium lividum]
MLPLKCFFISSFANSGDISANLTNFCLLKSNSAMAGLISFSNLSLLVLILV